MSLPFTTDQFLNVFAAYNNAIWPLQFLLSALGVLAIVLCFRTRPLSMLVSAILGGLWIWMGLIYHVMFFSAINPAAYIFGGLFILQGMLFFVSGLLRREITFGFEPGLRGYAGVAILAYALIFYPSLGYLLGHLYPSSPTFGVPCPTTIFTFGLLLLTRNRLPRYLLIIPFLWSIIGLSAALQLGIREDIGLLISGLISTSLLLLRKPAAVPPA